MISASKKVDQRKILSILAFGLFILVLLCSHNLAWSQEKGFPNKPIKIILSIQPGGAGDLATRGEQEYLAAEFGVPIIIVNIPGAGGVHAVQELLRAEPDGHTILRFSDSIFVNALQVPNPTFHPFKDLLPICQFGNMPGGYAVHVSSPFKTIADFVKEAKKNPDKLAVGTTNVGASMNVSLQLFKKDAGLDIKMIPYKGAGPAVTALLGKHIDMLVLSYAGLLPYVKSGELRFLAVTDQVPDGSIPTIMAEGYPRSLASASQGYIVSAKTPKPIYEKLVRSFERVEKNPAVAKRIEGLGMMPIRRTAAEFTKMMEEKLIIYFKYLEELGIKRGR